jgi:hypothetical protein
VAFRFRRAARYLESIERALGGIGDDMAQKVQIRLVDDYDGSDAQETVTFGLDGATFEMELSEKNAQSLRKAIEPYASKARKVSGRASASTKRSGSNLGTAQTKAIREWAAATGREVSTRGRISSKVLQEYEAAH